MSHGFNWRLLAVLAALVAERRARSWLDGRFTAEHPDLYGPHPTA